MADSPFAQDRAHHLEVIEAVLLVGEKRAEVLDVIASAADRAGAVEQLRDSHGFTEWQAAAVLDCQLVVLTADRRQAMIEERDLLIAVRDAGAPVVRLRGGAISPGHLRASDGDHVYEVHEREPDAALGRLVEVVRERVGRPALADVVIDFAAPISPDGPIRIEVSPTGEARFLYPDDEFEQVWFDQHPRW